MPGLRLYPTLTGHFYYCRKESLPASGLKSAVRYGGATIPSEGTAAEM